MTVLIVAREALSIATPYTSHSIWPATLIVPQRIEMSLVDLVRQDCITCGSNARATSDPAAKPISSTGSMLVVNHISRYLLEKLAYRIHRVVLLCELARFLFALVYGRGLPDATNYFKCACQLFKAGIFYHFLSFFAEIVTKSSQLFLVTFKNTNVGSVVVCFADPRNLIAH